MQVLTTLPRPSVGQPEITHARRQKTLPVAAERFRRHCGKPVSAPGFLEASLSRGCPQSRHHSSIPVFGMRSMIAASRSSASRFSGR